MSAALGPLWVRFGSAGSALARGNARQTSDKRPTKLGNVRQVREKCRELAFSMSDNAGRFFCGEMGENDRVRLITNWIE